MKKDLKRYSPDFHRIPHFPNIESSKDSDDITLLCDVVFPLEVWVQEKVDGSNVGVSWMNDQPLLRNREKILRKEYSNSKNLSKGQYVPLWNWMYTHKKDILDLIEKIGLCTIYGEWLLYEHSISYDNLPDYFLAYDIWSYEKRGFLKMDEFDRYISSTGIHYIKPVKMKFNDISEIKEFSEKRSEYKNGVVEGIVLKNDEFVAKIVNKRFIRRKDFNKNGKKNKITKTWTT